MAALHPLEPIDFSSVAWDMDDEKDSFTPTSPVTPVEEFLLPTPLPIPTGGKRGPPTAAPAPPAKKARKTTTTVKKKKSRAKPKPKPKPKPKAVVKKEPIIIIDPAIASVEEERHLLRVCIELLRSLVQKLP